MRRFASLTLRYSSRSLENVREAPIVLSIVDLVSGQLTSPDGTVDHHRRAAPLVGAPHHRGNPLFRLFAPGPCGPARARRFPPSWSPTPDYPCGANRVMTRSTCMPWSDPELLRHPDRQSLRLAGMVRVDIKENFPSSTMSWWPPGNRRRGACPLRIWPSASTHCSPSSTNAAKGSRRNPEVMNVIGEVAKLGRCGGGRYRRTLVARASQRRRSHF